MAAKRFVRSGAKRKTLWLQFQAASTTNAGSSASVVFSLNAAALALRPFTIVRTHFSYFLGSDQAAAIEDQTCAWGAAVVSDQAVAIGVTGVPTPNTDLGSSLWFALKLMFAKETSITDRATKGEYFDLDSKAMRKVEIGQDMVIVVENAFSTGWVLKQAGRILVKTN